MSTEVLQELKEIKEALTLNQPVLSLRQFCKLADISMDFAYQLTSKGKISFYRPFGKKIYIDRDEAILFLKQNKVLATADINSIASTNFLTSKNVAR